MSYYRAADPMARVPKMTRGKISLARSIHCCPNFLPPDQRLYTVHNMCICTHISDTVQTV